MVARDGSGDKRLISYLVHSVEPIQVQLTNGADSLKSI